MSILNVAIGEDLSPFVKPPITQEQLQRYAQASGHPNPIPPAEAAARRVGLDTVIAHGMLSMAFLGQFVNQQITDIPEAYLVQLKVRFMSMVRLGDPLTCHGFVRGRTDDTRQAAVAVDSWAQNQKAEKVTTGEAVVAVPLTTLGH